MENFSLYHHTTTPNMNQPITYYLFKKVLSLNENVAFKWLIGLMAIALSIGSYATNNVRINATAKTVSETHEFSFSDNIYFYFERAGTQNSYLWQKETAPGVWVDVTTLNSEAEEEEEEPEVFDPYYEVYDGSLSIYYAN